ncbi:MAG TPA: hypothetical protein PL066_01860 [bacterium]|nr:hypothetical protein [bacterium]
MPDEKMFLTETPQEAGNLFFKGPELVSPEEKNERIKTPNFYFSDKQPITKRYNLGINDEKPFLVIEFFDSLPDGLTQEEKTKFTKEIERQGDSERIVYVMKHGNFPQKEEPEPGYHVATPRKFEPLLKPQTIETEQLVEILKNKKILFYTGAGISMASGIKGMDQLVETLGIKMSEKIDELLKKALINPQEILNSWLEFTKTGFEKPATLAHQSLGRLAQKLNSQIFTENFDQLQEKTGIKAIHIKGPWLKENIKPMWLKNIDIIITVGLKEDDRGFLGWYKEHNPSGKIIAINLSQPNYLGDEDFILKGDCQKIVPEMESEFLKF